MSGLPEAPDRVPGLLTQWAREDGAWLGRVVYGVVDGDRVVLVEAWVPSEHLTPATSD